MIRSRRRPWLWLAAVWLVTASCPWLINAASLGYPDVIFAGCGFIMAITVTSGFIGGYYRRWSITLLGTQTLIIALTVGEGIADVINGRWSINSFLPDAEPWFLIPLNAGVMLLGALIGHGLGTPFSRRYPPGHCRSCGYNLTGNTSGICPECGTPIPDDDSPSPASDRQA